MSSKRGAWQGGKVQRAVKASARWVGRWQYAAWISRCQQSALVGELLECVRAMHSIRCDKGARDLTPEEMSRLAGYYTELDELEVCLDV